MTLFIAIPTYETTPAERIYSTASTEDVLALFAIKDDAEVLVEKDGTIYRALWCPHNKVMVLLEVYCVAVTPEKADAISSLLSSIFG